MGEGWGEGKSASKSGICFCTSPCHGRDCDGDAGGGVGDSSLFFLSSTFFFASLRFRPSVFSLTGVVGFSTCLLETGRVGFPAAAGVASGLICSRSSSRCLALPTAFGDSGRAGGTAGFNSTAPRPSFLRVGG